MESVMFWQRGRAWLICRTNAHLSTPPRIYGGGRVALSFAGRKTVSEERFDPPPSTTLSHPHPHLTPPPPSTAPIFDGRQNKQHCAGFILCRSCFCCHSEVWRRMRAKPILTRVGVGGWGWRGCSLQNTVFTETTSSFYGSVKTSQPAFVVQVSSCSAWCARGSLAQRTELVGAKTSRRSSARHAKLLPGWQQG